MKLSNSFIIYRFAPSLADIINQIFANQVASQLRMKSRRLIDFVSDREANHHLAISDAAHDDYE
jgi:hypothetical protein